MFLVLFLDFFLWQLMSDLMVTNFRWASLLFHSIFLDTCFGWNKEQNYPSVGTRQITWVRHRRTVFYFEESARQAADPNTVSRARVSASFFHLPARSAAPAWGSWMETSRRPHRRPCSVVRCLLAAVASATAFRQEWQPRGAVRKVVSTIPRRHSSSSGYFGGFMMQLATNTSPMSGGHGLTQKPGMAGPKTDSVLCERTAYQYRAAAHKLFFLSVLRHLHMDFISFKQRWVY